MESEQKGKKDEVRDLGAIMRRRLVEKLGQGVWHKREGENVTETEAGKVSGRGGGALWVVGNNHGDAHIRNHQNGLWFLCVGARPEVRRDFD